MTDKTDLSDIETMKFEQALSELEQIVGQLEHANVELEQSITIYERGEALRNHCDRLLKLAEAKVEKITQNGSGEAIGTSPIEIQ